MSKRNKKTGLGTDAFFAKPETEEKEEKKHKEEAKESKEPKGKAVVERKKPEKVRTTVTLYPRHLAIMEELKIAERRKGIKATYSDILGEALDLIAEEKNLEP